jgi:signal transduction histidine kinase
MKFSAFIVGNLDKIVAEWETFARTLLPAAKTMSALALRTHSRDILLAIAKDMETSQTKSERSSKSKQMLLADGALETAAAAHGALRQLAGFDLTQLVGEFRAMRASVLAMWRRSEPEIDGTAAIEEIARFNEGIDQALAESVERYSSDISTFLAVIGHDLRSPLWAIQGTSELLLTASSLSDASRKEALTRIQRSSKAMARLIGDLLEYTATQLGRGIPVSMAACELGSVCRDAVETLDAIYPDRTFSLEVSGNLQIEADAARIQQVFTNLLQNAVQHGNDAAIGLCAVGSADEIVVQISNGGEPIPADAFHSIFDPLVQIPSSKSEPHEHPYTSMGMGLYIAREIVNRHGGKITVVSTLKSGTTFTVSLPRSRS